MHVGLSWLGILMLAGCRQQMANQPYHRPLTESRLFADGRSARPLVEGTVARGTLALGPVSTGREQPAKRAAAKAAALVGNPIVPVGGPAVAAAEDEAPYLDVLPFAPESLAAMMLRGRERYDIFCSPCHDRVGNGKGMIVLRGFTAPPSLHADLSRGFLIKKREVKLPEAPVGYYFDVISNGFGAMPDHRAQIPVEDRWAIIAYVRALQLSQNAPPALLRDRPMPGGGGAKQ